MATQKLCLLGSTGSIGTQTLSLVTALGIQVTSISGYRSAGLLEAQARRFRPRYVAAADLQTAKLLRTRLADTNCKVLGGPEGLEFIAAQDGADTVLTSVVGAAGLRPTVAAIRAGKTIALANKETLVAGGRLITGLVREHGVRLLPVDSEHSAIFQCLQDPHSARTLRRIFLTASGGPFFGRTRAQLADVTVADALHHPNWSMGKKITVDSATLMNKGLELIEAMWLFSLPPEAIEITVQRQSIVHSMVEFADGSVLAQLGVPDMRIPIQYALTYPERKPSPVEPLTIERMNGLTFERPDDTAFECLAACRLAARRGGLVPCIANAANEVAVARFLEGRLGFLHIGEAVMRAVNSAPDKADYTLEELFAADGETRAETAAYLDRAFGRNE